MALQLFKSAILTTDIPDHDLHAGDVGTIVEEHRIAGMSEPGYSVEFFDMTGQTVAVVTVPASSLREPTPSDRPSVRIMSTH